MTITREALAAMFPRAIPAWFDALHELAPVLGDHYNFNRLDWCHFCGQISAETNGLSLPSMRENMAFRTPRRIMEVYSYRLGIALKREPDLARRFGTREKLAAHLVNKPKDLADIVYGGREGTPWMQGSKYIGRGPTQVTHLNNYRAVGEEIATQPGGDAFDLVGNPDLLATDPELGIRAAFADWHIKGLSRWARQDRADLVSDKLNTGNVKDNVKPHNLAGRLAATAKAKKIWKTDFTLDGAAPSDPVSKPAPKVPAPTVPVPTEAKDLAKVSRKVSFLWRLYKAARLALAGFTATAIADGFGFAKGVLNDVQVFVADHSLAVVITGVIVAGASARWLVSLSQQDAANGTWVPSGLAKGEASGDVGADGPSAASA